jgi:hypothetical protein
MRGSKHLKVGLMCERILNFCLCVALIVYVVVIAYVLFVNLLFEAHRFHSSIEMHGLV